MTGKSGQTRVAHKRTLPLEEYQSLAQALLGEFATYYAVAKAIGDSNLRAGFRRLVLNADSPSPRLREALDTWTDVDVIIIEASPDISLFGEVSLLNTDAVVFVMARVGWERHSIPCAVCQTMTPRWSSSQKYCDRHSYSTQEGRRWHRQQRKERHN